MAIEFQCVHCNRVLKLKDKCAGLRGECPFCKGVITVPTLTAPVVEKRNETEKSKDTEEPEFTAPTKKQLDYARKLGIDIPKGVSRSALSLLIDGAKDNAPATEKQKEFLRELGVKFADDIRLNQASMLIDGAMNIRDEISSALQRRLEEQWKEAGMLIEHVSVEQLLREITSRGKPFVAFVMDDDEFHYGDNPMKGRLLWNDYLTSDDVKYLIASLAVGWAKNLDMNKYNDEYDGKPPELEFSASELAIEADNVVHLNIAPFAQDLDS
jgi:hypothetical protein